MYDPDLQFKGKRRCVVIGAKAEMTHCQSVAGMCYLLYSEFTELSFFNAKAFKPEIFN